jgi:hypothetical protein
MLEQWGLSYPVAYSPLLTLVSVIFAYSTSLFVVLGCCFFFFFFVFARDHAPD